MALNKVVSDFVSAATAPQFDSSATVATTEFVRREIGNRRGFRAYSSTVALTSADIGKSIQLGGTGGSVLTLPSASSGSTPGQIIEVFTNTSWTVVPSGTDLIGLGGASSATSVALSSGDTAVFVSGGNGVWYLVGGTSSLRASGGDFGKSLVANGYQKLPSGLIIQWGQTTALAVNTNVILSLPLSFPTACLNANACFRNRTGGTGAPTIGVGAVTQSTIQVTNEGDTTVDIFWFAIGN